jgi:hypothetical protein
MLLWILQPVLMAAWDLYAIYTLFTLDCPTFNLPQFNLYFLIVFNFVAVLYVFVFIPHRAMLYCRKLKQNEKEKMQKSAFIGRLPVIKFNPQTNTTQDYCVICMVDFTETSKISWLPCDIRHYCH